MTYEKGGRFNLQARRKDVKDLWEKAPQGDRDDLAQFYADAPKMISNLSRYADWMEIVFKMNVSIRDSEALMQVNPEILHDHLRDWGWEFVAQNDLAMVFRKNGVEILAPKYKTLGDYVHRVKECISSISVESGMMELEVYFRLVY